MSPTIIFSTRPHSIGSWLIRRATKSKVSHVSIGSDIHGVDVALEAGVSGVTPMIRSKFEATNIIVEQYWIKDGIVSEEALKHAVEEIGEGFDYAGLLGFGLVILVARWFRKKIKNPWASPKTVWCSEFVLHLNRDKTIPEWNDFEPESVTPEDLRAACESGSSFERTK